MVTAHHYFKKIRITLLYLELLRMRNDWRKWKFHFVFLNMGTPVLFISSASVPPLLKSSGLNGIGSILSSIFLLKGTIFLRSSNLSPVKALEIKATSMSLSGFVFPLAWEPKMKASVIWVLFFSNSSIYLVTIFMVKSFLLATSNHHSQIQANI